MADLVEALKLIGLETLPPGTWGGFQEDEQGLYWSATWAGDAPGDEPKDTTYQAGVDAMELVRRSGFECDQLYNEHDYVSFRIVTNG